MLAAWENRIERQMVNPTMFQFSLQQMAYMTSQQGITLIN
jgi:hypothetical protein